MKSYQVHLCPVSHILPSSLPPSPNSLLVKELHRLRHRVITAPSIAQSSILPIPRRQHLAIIRQNQRMLLPTSHTPHSAPVVQQALHQLRPRLLRFVAMSQAADATEERTPPAPGPELPLGVDCCCVEVTIRREGRREGGETK